MTGGNVYNRPRSALHKNQKRSGRIKKQQKKSQGKVKTKQPREELVTTHILRKTLTNPTANITLSGKKKRLLLKQLKREQKEQSTMELDKQVEQEKKETTAPKRQGKEKMEFD